eukprot:2253512-Amphidinium_carterae.1
MPGTRLHKRTCLTSSDLPGSPASVLTAEQSTFLPLDAEQELSGTSTYICGVEHTSCGKRKIQRGMPFTCNLLRQLVHQPLGGLLREFSVACVRTRANRNLVATLLKRPALRYCCPGPWTWHLGISVPYKQCYTERSRRFPKDCKPPSDYSG